MSDCLHHYIYCELLDEVGLLQADLFIFFEDLKNQYLLGYQRY